MGNNKLYLLPILFLFLSSCGGGGGGGSSSPPPSPTASLSSSSSSVLLGSVINLNWSSFNTTSCSASGAWEGAKATSGTEDITINTPGNNFFSINCSGANGSATASVTVEGYRNTDGVTVDGYIRQADIFIDTDNSYALDPGEDSTTSDNEGKFTIKYSDGNLISLGGTDLDSGNPLDNLLIVHKLTGHSDFKALTPVTSIAAFMVDPSLVNLALGIDDSLDITTADPVAGKGDNGINDYLYEKGNQLTVLAYALQNTANNLNVTTETTQDYFKAIAEEVDAEYTSTSSKVDIETETFITKVIDNIIAAKTLTVVEENRSNLITALASVMPIIEVKATDALSTAVFDFATSTLQTDAQALANGSATAETIESYQTDILNYIATDQEVDPDELAPDITAIADEASLDEDQSVDVNSLANDSYLTSAPISLEANNGSNGSTSVSNNIVTYSPDTDFNGSDSFTYTITQGDKTSSANVAITVNPVNDAPTFDNLLSTYSVAENQTAITTVVGADVDGDSLTISLSGTDASSFNLSTDNVLTFIEAPDYETRASYAITLSVSDESETSTKDITILVTNVNDIAPVITSDATFSAAENQTAIGTVTATDAEGDTLTYAVSGTELAISSTGVLTFITAPDYETKTSYTATITVNDGVNTTNQDITITVLNVNDVAL
ncbi:MAG: Ig-like domain-containing protein, partial [Gammaproteobacteria bacterium]